MKNKKWYFEDFPPGKRIDLPARTVSAEEIVEFASEFDPYPFHLDAQAAVEHGFDGLIASGWHLCAISMRMMCDAFILESSSQGSPGIEYCKWLKPVCAGDTLSGYCEVMDARTSSSRPGLGIGTWMLVVENQNGEKVMENRYKSFFLTREGAAA